VNPETGSTECFRLGDGGGSATDISWNVGLVAAVDVAEPSRSPSSDPVVISGFVFHDVNNNGYLEDGEDGGVFGVQVALFDCSDDGVSSDSIIIDSLTTTDANGMYGFEVDPGSYVVKFSSWEGYRVSDVWSGQMDEEGARQVAPDAENEADPATGSTSCEEYQAGDAVYSLDAGMYLPSSSLEKDEGSSSSDASNSLPSPTSRPTQDPKGDGTPCSGVPCLIPGMCRNASGLCGKGIGFCNPNSVWESNCPPEEEDVIVFNPVDAAPTLPSSALTPTAAPKLPISLSNPPSTSGSAGGPSDVIAYVTVCNDDGSVGTTTTNSGEGAVQITEISFIYALKSENGASPDAALVAKFEKDLNTRLSCSYFDDPCLACGDGSKQNDVNDKRVLLGSLRGRRMSRAVARNMITVEDSSVMGISSMPRDFPSTVEVCVGSQSDCRVINGKFTAYFPLDMQTDAVDEEAEYMLEIVNNELSKNDWEGMQVSYNNAPFLAVDMAEKDSGNESGGLSPGAIVGIVFGILSLIAISAASTILFVRRKREKDEEQFGQQRSAPAGDAGPSIESKGNDDDVSESDDSDDSSSSSGSSSSEEEDEDGSGAMSFPSSAISGDTFLTNVAQARPQDLDDDETTDSSDDDESYDEGPETEKMEAAPPLGADGQNSTQRLQQSAASDENPAVYEDGTGNYHGEEYAEDYNGEGQGYDSGNYHGQEDGYGGQEDTYDEREVEYLPNYDETGQMNDDDDTGSMMSGDPPGTSYRDLPQGDEWDGVVAPPQPIRYHMNPEGGFSEENFSSTQQRGSFHEYENEGVVQNDSYVYEDEGGAQSDSYVYEDEGGALTDSSQSSGHLDDNQSNPGSYHSQQSHGFSGSHHSVHSNRSFHSQGSRHSVHSNHSSQSQGSRHSVHTYHSSQSQGSRHSVHTNHSSQSQGSRHSDPSIHSSNSQQDDNQQGYSQYGDKGQFHQEHADGNYVHRAEHHDQHNPQPPPYNNEYDQYAADGANINYDYVNETPMVSQFGDDMVEGDQYSPMQSENTDEHRGGAEDDGFDEESYHSFKPILNSKSPSRPEELDEVSHTGSAYTAVTHQMSNASSGVDINSPSQETCGEEEESITNIFKSLSEIQTRLASKGKPLPDGAPIDSDLGARSSKARFYQSDMYAPSYQPPINNGWGKEGIVEDASMDGSQVSSFAANAVRNRRPQQGQWMEPVDEAV